MSGGVWVQLLFLSCVLASDRPRIGILFQEPSHTMAQLWPDMNGYIAASYVRAVQAAGARVVPIHLNRTEAYYRSVIQTVNGLLLPGGNTWFYGHPGGYVDSGELLLREAKALNEGGVNFPVVGICLGMELLLFVDNGRSEYRASCTAKNVALPLELRPDFRNSSLFRAVSAELEAVLRTEPVTFNQHGFCVTERNLTSTGLDKHWKVLSTNLDNNTGLEFISTIEAKEYPFVGLQFHPEKNPYEWGEELHVPHTPDAYRATRYFFDWFVAEARLNNNAPKSDADGEESLVYHYPTLAGDGRISFDEIYTDGRGSEHKGAAPTNWNGAVQTSLLLVLASAAHLLR